VAMRSIFQPMWRTDEDPASLARYISVVRHGLAVLACDGVPRAELENSAHRALDGLSLRMAARSA